jgi:F-type H+-transporting ATPase subunit delta
VDKNTVARRYATALSNLLDSSDVEVARNGLQTFSRLLNESPSLKHVLASPVFTVDEKSSILNELSERTKSPPVMKDFLGQLLKKNRLALLPEIAEAFSVLADQRKGIQHVWVSSAQALSTGEQQQLQSTLATNLQREVNVTFQTDPTLIAGILVRIGSRVFDSTIRGRLMNMRSLLSKG